MSDKLDYKKEYKDLYLPKSEPVFIKVPPIPFIMVDGRGDPDGEEYHQAVELLYALTFTIKMSKMNGTQPEGYFEYVVPPLEGLWSCGDGPFQLSRREEWQWTSMIRQPEFVTKEVFHHACELAAKKKPELDFSKARFEVYSEDACVQIMHIGPYSTELDSVVKMMEFMKQNGWQDDCGGPRFHHEIYLGDPRKTAPEKLKTVLRHPVKPAEKQEND